MTSISVAHADVLILLSAARDAHKDGQHEDAMNLAYMALARARRENLPDLRYRARILFMEYSKLGAPDIHRCFDGGMDPIFREDIVEAFSSIR